MGATSKGGLRGLTCSGSRPWLGDDAREPCKTPTSGTGDTTMLALQRGASNLYFPEVASSILIPPYSSKIFEVLENRQVLEVLDSAREEGEIPYETFKIVAQMVRVDPAQLRDAYLAQTGERQSEVDEDEVPFRHAEYLALHQERRDRDDALACRPQIIAEYGPIVRDFLDHVSLIESLTETRALTGFSRIEPGGENSGALSVAHVSWLPAFRVRVRGSSWASIYND